MESYMVKNENARSPTLQTVLMVEKFIKEHSGEYKKTEVFNNLPKKVMWQTFQVIMAYLEEGLRIVYDGEGHAIYIWNPRLVEQLKNKKELEWNPK